MSAKANPLGSQPIGKLLKNFAVPSVVSMLAMAVYNIVDQIFIGQGVGYLGNAFLGWLVCMLFPAQILSLFGDAHTSFNTFAVHAMRVFTAGIFCAGFQVTASAYFHGKKNVEFVSYWLLWLNINPTYQLDKRDRCSETVLRNGAMYSIYLSPSVPMDESDKIFKSFINDSRVRTSDSPAAKSLPPL